VAPSAIALAASRPVRSPPVATTGRPAAAAPTTETAVGTPQSLNTLAQCRAAKVDAVGRPLSFHSREAGAARAADVEGPETHVGQFECGSAGHAGACLLGDAGDLDSGHGGPDRLADTGHPAIAFWLDALLEEVQVDGERVGPQHLDRSAQLVGGKQLFALLVHQLSPRPDWR